MSSLASVPRHAELRGTGCSQAALCSGRLYQPAAVRLPQLHPCWPSDALHPAALPRGPPPRTALVSPGERTLPVEPWGSSGCAEPRRRDLWGTLLSQNQQSQAWLATTGEAHADPQSFPSRGEHGCRPREGVGSSKAQHGAQHKMAAGLGGEDGGPGRPAVAPAGWATSVVSRDPGVAPEELPGRRGRFLFAARAEASALQPPPALRFRQGLPPGAPLHYQLARCLFQDTVVKLCWAGAVIWGFLSCQPRRQIR